MATLSDRNLSFEQAQAMWPGVTLDPKESLNFTVSMKPEAQVIEEVKSAVAAMHKDLRLNRNGIGWGDLDDPRFSNKPVDNVSVPKETINMIRKQFDMSKEAVKADVGKPDWSLVPFEALEGMVRVLEFGANKYSRNNWMTGGGFSYRRVLTACMRHLFAFLSGEDKDPESGLSHIHHAQCNLLFLAMYLTNKEKFNKDDREPR